ncbi:DNA-binding response regulator [Paenibacillus sambharensis]|uniref:DNA-binding response regulator n=1 Tax=Paenibacillus sambharensis TaxID=1803190 RepID=A0A2W1LLH6_9BACL|nr:response regulator [Paenibacillus sambharensis]PZD95812.1 DNA-binding response regulator [Paenibacillus sambharensis]
MYTIMLVDDEDEVREGMKLKTDWEGAGFRLVGDYANGVDALEGYEALKPDVVITDICMPFMDGLELSRRILAQSKDVKLVIVTGYEDFEYAKQAIKLNVKDYLLKPVNLAEFTAFLGGIKQELDADRAHREDLSALRRKLNESFPLLRERFLDRLSITRLSADEVARKFAYFHLSLPGPTYLALVADLDEPAGRGSEVENGRETADGELLRFAAANIFKEWFEGDFGGIVFQTREDRIAVFAGGLPGRLEAEAGALAEHARDSVAKYLKLSVTVGIGSLCESPCLLSDSFREASAALDYRFLMGRGAVISIGDLEFGRGNGRTQGQWEASLIAAVKSGQIIQVTDITSQWISEQRRSGMQVTTCMQGLYKVLVALMNWVSEAGFDEQAVLGSDPFSRVRRLQTLDEAGEWLLQTCRQVMEHVTEKRSHVHTGQIEAALHYIEQRYTDPAFSLQELCGHLYLSVSYFSSLFKQATGETFVERLTRLRIEKAKELLAFSALKTYEIAGKVGYNDPQYFSVLFKRLTGETPKAFRASRRGSVRL